MFEAYAMPRMASGIGLRRAHERAFREQLPAVGFVEIHAENYMPGGAALPALLRLRRDFPVSVHGVGLSLGSVERPDPRHLDRLGALCERVEPALVSEHLSFSSVGEVYLNDLLPLPMTMAALRVVARNVDIVQQALGRPILIENPSRYLAYRGDELAEPQFLNEVASRTGCGVLLDVNNVHVSAVNVDGDASAWLAAIDALAIGEIHLAGHSRVDVDGVTLLVDDHGSAVTSAVWTLFERAVRMSPAAPALVEWDSRLPPLERLVAEAAAADSRRIRALGLRRPRVRKELDHALAH